MLEQEAAHAEATLERVAGNLFAPADPEERDLLVGDDTQRALGRVGDRWVRVGGRHLHRQLAPAHSGELGREHEEIGAVRERRECPREAQRKVEVILGIALVVEGDHRILEAEQHPGVDLEREIEINRALAAFLGVEVDLPRLPERITLHEVALVVHVKPVLDGVVLQIGNESRNIDNCHVNRRAHRMRGATQRNQPDRIAARVECAREAEEAVDQSVVTTPLDRDPGALEPVGVRLALVAERIELGGQHDRGSNAGNVGDAQRRDPPVGRIGTRTRVALEEPPHLRGFEQVAARVLRVRRRARNRNR